MNIVYFKGGRDGCQFYRLKQIATFMGRIEGNEVKEFDPLMDESKLLDIAKGADVFLGRIDHIRMVKFLKQAIDCSKKVFILDIDDSYWNVNPLSPMYRVYGTKDMDINGEPLWRNGEDNFHIAANRERLEDLACSLEEVDMVTVTTQVLKDNLSNFCNPKKILIVPNAVDFTHWNKWDFKDKEQIRIGWTGGSTHYPDWRSVSDNLKDIEKENIKWVLQGCKWDYTLQGLDYEFHDWVDVECYPYKLASLDIDIAVIPLADLDFNYNKSNIKWVEFSSLGVPCVIPNLSPYKEEAVHMETALVYNSPEEFVEYTNLLIHDKELREKIGRQAREYMEKNKDVRNIAQKYSDELKQLLEEKDGNK